MIKFYGGGSAERPMAASASYGGVRVQPWLPRTRGEAGRRRGGLRTPAPGGTQPQSQTD